MPIVTFIRWFDACQKEAADAGEAIPEVTELVEVGFLLAETDEAVLIGMEQESEGAQPGRWRLNIPKVNIRERRDVPLAKAFGVKLPRKPATSQKRAAVYG